eukprot:10615370-Lingulodinium_polyedra.AAC.1
MSCCGQVEAIWEWVRSARQYTNVVVVMATIMVVGSSGIMAVSLVVVMAVIAAAMHTCSRLASPPEQVPP